MKLAASVQELDGDDAGVDLGGVIDAIRTAVTRYHGIEAQTVVLVEQVSLPTTSSGKIRRGECRQQFLDGDLASRCPTGGRYASVAGRRAGNLAVTLSQWRS